MAAHRKKWAGRLAAALLFSVSIPIIPSAFSRQVAGMALPERVESIVRELKEEGDIPGLSLIIVSGSQSVIRHFGYGDVAERKPVTGHTLFQIGSCSKAFTALGAMRLISDGAIDPDAAVSDYLPWFRPRFEGRTCTITIRQLLHHTSGIPWESISLIPETNAPDALEQTVRKVANIQLEHKPGEEYEYATINYDVLALVIATVTGQAFETWMQQHILDALQLYHTTIGAPADSIRMARGYKIGFFRARPWQAPVFKGNNAAGYVITDAGDMEKWLRFQMGLSASGLYTLAQQTQMRDETVAPRGLFSYAMGWQVSLSGNGEISHAGLNPNFSSYIAFRPADTIGIAVLANSNSNFTPLIGDRIMRLLAGEKITDNINPGDGNDGAFSLLSIVLACYILSVIIYLAIMLRRRAGGFNRPDRLRHSWRKLLVSCLLTAPVFPGIWFLPEAAGFSWNSVWVWAPVSFISMVGLLAGAIVVSFMVYAVHLFLPGKEHWKSEAPALILVSIVSGIANMSLVLLITSAFREEVSLEYISFYFLLVLLIYITGRKYVQVRLIYTARRLVHELRMQLTAKVFSASYRNFERVDKGRIYATFNDDIYTIGESAAMIVGLVTSCITVAGAFLYLATVAFWATAVTLGLILGISVLYYYVGKRSEVFLQEARDTQNVYMRLINGMVDGFKEISLRRRRKAGYQNDMSLTSQEYREKMSVAQIRFVNANLIGETSLILLLGVVAFALEKLFPDIQQYTITGFIIIILYLNGPLNTILSAVPSVMQLKIAWGRIRSFLQEFPSGNGAGQMHTVTGKEPVESIRAEQLYFSYENGEGADTFAAGPVDLEVRKGEILFIIGANGSGKTTLAKLITGLYHPDKGNIYINNKIVPPAQLGEYFSATFSPCYVFSKLYDLDLKDKSADITRYLQLLGLEGKVEIINNRFSTVDLSGGQRKRLLLLQCYLEDAPVYLFDEWAADQDPAYRRFFYRELLPEMKRKGKIVIAITHDDHYFDVADKIIKMDMGKVELVPRDFKVDSLLSN